MVPEPVRDLGDERLWDISLRRSLDRRNAPSPRAFVRPRTASVATLLVGAAALPAGIGVAPAAASSGLTAVQQALGVTADGQMGPQTRRAIRKFQRSHGLTVDGRVGPQTRKALGISGTSNSTTKLKVTGGSVADVQRKLGVDADGVMGPVTRKAVRDFQAAHDLEATGRLDRATRTAILQSDDAESGATTRSVSGAQDAPAPAQGVQAAVDAAREQIGKPYQSAGKGPNGFDCSGLTAFAFKAAGISLGASSFAQYGQGTSVSKSEIQAGDLVFFNSNGSGASHVGIATGPTTMISATSHGVMENSFTSGYWGAHYVGARRVTS